MGEGNSEEANTFLLCAALDVPTVCPPPTGLPFCPSAPFPGFLLPTGQMGRLRPREAAVQGCQS